MTFDELRELFKKYNELMDNVLDRTHSLYVDTVELQRRINTACNMLGDKASKTQSLFLYRVIDVLKGKPTDEDRKNISKGFN